MVIFVFTEHANEYNGLWQTGCKEAFSELPEGYKVVDEWSITRPENLLHEAWPDLTASLEEVRHVRIVADQPYHDISLYAPETMATPYDWEEELELALLSIEAKNHLRSQGVAV